jgi:hypothetical protein
VSAPWWKDRQSQFLQTKHRANKLEDDDSLELSSTRDSDHMAALVPVVDMLNHSPTSQITYFTDMQAKRFCLKTRSGVKLGNQAFNNYGLRSNEKLLLSYGFILEDNFIDSFHIKVAWSGNDEFKQERMSLLKKLNIKPSKLSYLSTDKHRPLLGEGTTTYTFGFA